MTIQEYITWYNALPSRVKAVEPWDGKSWRRQCPACGEPMFAKMNEYNELCMDMIHRETCALWLEHHEEWDRENKRITANMAKIRAEIDNATH